MMMWCSASLPPMSAVNHDLRVSSIPTEGSRDGAALACDDGIPARLALAGTVVRGGSSSSSNLFRRWNRGVPDWKATKIAFSNP